MSKHHLFRKCDCGKDMRVLVDHDDNFVEATGCYLCYNGALRFKVNMPKHGTLIVGVTSSKFVPKNSYINVVVCMGCLKNRLIHTFVEIVPNL